ncbi:Endonuclease III [Candidatus Hepatincola sp. Pdp]
MLNAETIFAIFKTLKTATPTAKTELNYTNNYTLLIAVVLSAQAKDSSVNIATKELFKKASTPKEMLALGEENLKNYIKSIGLYKNKAKNIIKLSQQLINTYNSQVPNKFTDLIELAGVGRKTANVILNVAFNKPTMPVDTHVFRVARRMGLSNGKDVLAVEQDLLAKIPEPYRQDSHHLLILHGRYVCKAKNFDCNSCIINAFCEKHI